MEEESSEGMAACTTRVSDADNEVAARLLGRLTAIQGCTFSSNHSTVAAIESASFSFRLSAYTWSWFPLDNQEALAVTGPLVKSSSRGCEYYRSRGPWQPATLLACYGSSPCVCFASRKSCLLLLSWRSLIPQEIDRCTHRPAKRQVSGFDQQLVLPTRHRRMQA